MASSLRCRSRPFPLPLLLACTGWLRAQSRWDIRGDCSSRCHISSHPAKAPFHTDWTTIGLGLALEPGTLIIRMGHAYWFTLSHKPSPIPPSQGGDTPKTGRGLFPRPHEEAGKEEEAMGEEKATTLHFICSLAELLSPPFSPLLR